MKSFTNKKGMTLVEIMVAAAVGLMVVTVALRFTIQTLKSYQYETGKLLVNRDIRKFTLQMTDDATFANSFLIFDQAGNLNRATYTPVGSGDPTSSTYQGYTADLATTTPDDPVTDTGPGTANVASGRPGDIVVFIYNPNGDNTKISQLIIYYRVIATTPAGTNGTNSSTITDRIVALKRLAVKIPAGVQSAGIMKLLPELTATTAGSIIFSNVDGRASDSPPGSVNRRNKMFYNNNGSVLVRGSIYENYTAQRLVKSTYNFTVTPRG